MLLSTSEVGPTVLIHICFAIYFLIRLFTLAPFLPHRSSYPSISFSRLVLLAFAPLLPLCLFGTPAAVLLPYLVSYTFATLAALRLTINAPFLPSAHVSLLLYPCLLLWRFEVLVYFVFFCLFVPSSQLAIPYILLAFAATCTTLYHLCMRAYQQQNSASSLQHVLAQIFQGVHQPRDIVAVPPSIRDSSLYTICFFRWVTPLVKTGNRRPLQLEDIPPMSHRFSTYEAASHFKQSWEKERTMQPPNQPRLSRALLRAYWRQSIPTLLTGLCTYLLLCVIPWLLRLIIIHLQNRGNGSGTPWPGFVIACVLFAVSGLQVALFHLFLDFLSKFESLVRSSLISIAYEKTTLLSPQSRDLYTSGQIQNLMATDVQSISEIPTFSVFLIFFVEQTCLCLAILVTLIGWIPSMAAIILIAAYVPLQTHMVNLAKRLREVSSSFTDERVKHVSEAIRGIKLVKLYAWEPSFVKRIFRTRAEELHHVLETVIVQAWNSILVTSFPIVLTFVVFATYAARGRVLDAAVVFPVIALFNTIRPALNYLPTALGSLARATASLSRMRNFLCADELKPLSSGIHAVDQDLLERDRIDLAAFDASFSWDPSVSSPTPTLNSISFRVPEGSLVAVVGPTGSGKSTLLAALLGEVPILSGKAGIRRNRSVSFCGQVPFIQNATVCDNILFGNPFEEKHYRTTIRVCSLEPDLELLPGGDKTEIGSRGVNLSGGQRLRIALARAVYSRSDIILLDDPLCAVDTHVGRSIFGDCIVSQLRGTTRLLTTNQIHYATSSAVDHVIVVRNGQVVESGSQKALLSCRTSEFAKLVETAGEVDAREMRETEVESSSRISGDDNTERIDLKPNGNIKMDFIHSKSDDTTSLVGNSCKKDYGSIQRGKLTKGETKEEGRVRLKHYATYIVALGPLAWVLPFLLFAFFVQVTSLGVNLWLSFWSEQSSAEHTLFNLLVFLILGLVAVMVTGISTFSLAFGSIRASKLLHTRLLLSVLGAPSSFFHTTPGGRIINRFHSDMDKVDSILAPSINAFVRLLFSLLFAIGLLVWATPALALVLLPIAVLCFYVQEIYRKTSVDIRRLQALTRSPLYSHIAETLDGVVTIRAFGNVSKGAHVNNVLVDQLNKVSYAVWYANRWLGIRLESLSVSLIFATVTLAVFTSPGRLSASLTGLVLSYTTQVLQGLTYTVRLFTDVESTLSSVERVSEYSSPLFPHEEEGGLAGTLKDQEGCRTSLTDEKLTEVISADGAMKVYHGLQCQVSQWPRNGRIDFERVWMRYRSDLEPALRNVSFSVQAGEHIGIVGRTGAGKTSTIQCLFRLHELERGRILIDGIDISTLRLFHLRSSLGIIPQEPVCFSGTIRSNLDMQGDHDDTVIQEALDSCGLQATMKEKVTLDDEVSEDGNNLSQGQKQILCLGRALLKNSQILILDEATSNVTNETDQAIRKTLEEKMQHCTIVTIAHRLHTVMKCDRIIVMDKGRVAEMGEPSELLKRKSWLKSLVDETGHATAARLRYLASQNRRGKPERDTGDDISFLEAESKEGNPSSVSR